MPSRPLYYPVVYLEAVNSYVPTTVGDRAECPEHNTGWGDGRAKENTRKNEM